MKQYICSTCFLKTTNPMVLINTEKAGCVKCGKSGYRCPRCGSQMRTKMTTTSTVQAKPDSEPQLKINTGQQEFSVQVGRAKTIKKKRLRKNE